ncbi:MAG TPA: sialate O-acetylesterase [Bacteroidota bacterium]|nr:sialate O-acetylesterase [Bacteroidota bacterium]
MYTKLSRAICIVSLFLSLPLLGEVRLPKLISDGMVLQRDAEITIWGWAAPGEKVEVHFLNKEYKAAADMDGDWSVKIPPRKAGGPYSMQIDGSNHLTVHDILIGEVWVCSGQSNMELAMSAVSWNYPGEIEHSENKSIRQFLVPQKYDFNAPQKDLISGSWKSASPENTPAFTAAGYFFAKELYNKYKVPVGLINSSLGGSPVESWISEDTLRKFPQYYYQALMLRDVNLIHKIEESDRARISAWYAMMQQHDKGYEDPQHVWYDPTLNTSDWPTMNIPGYWADTKLGYVNGSVWFRKQVDVPSSMTNKPATIILGRIVDGDSTFVNGVFVGTVSYQYPRRRYVIPAGLLKAGENSIAVRVISEIGKGGFVLDKQYAIVAGDTSINLEGGWKYRLGVQMPPLMGQTFIRWMPMGLYNAMIAPLVKFHIKGVIWYQGESNAGRPGEYLQLFSAMINDWRSKWGEGDFPFLYVQLPNFMEPRSEPSESNWALLREAQLKTLSVPNTGMAVTIDIGEWNDIHPLDKKDVGVRLELAAEKIAYHDSTVVMSGPIYQSMEVEGDTILISMTHCGTGLIARGGDELHCFAVAGADKKFVWAHAKIEQNKVIVWNESISHPLYVRYAWADDPVDPNLYNKEGLPASPFRTDGNSDR